ncbi:hypothetical protein [Spiroplasma ixodetis]|uniref:hypothetical protein n=1 Tax=Spiroplasma ixodetis TaxID=2141 RepID=UPI002578C158|nr:hypothetical protein [Spiroplasma ixodetis]WJG70215.1 hypothetical protein SIXOD_v1c12940 [Spiroplasma ixodetis Y32]
MNNIMRVRCAKCNLEIECNSCNFDKYIDKDKIQKYISKRKNYASNQISEYWSGVRNELFNIEYYLNEGEFD